MSVRTLLRRASQDASGATALEYALVLPILITSIMGAIWTGILMLAFSSMEMSAQSAARCAAVNASQCGSPSAVQAFAEARYAGPNISPVFTLSATGCGHTVTGQANFDLAIVPGVGSVPISVSACYP